jgi:hypothetical protein
LITRSTLLLEQIEDEIEESGEASKEAMDRFELFCQAMNVKADRIGSYLFVMEVRAEHCRKEDAALRSPHEKGSEQNRSHEGHGSLLSWEPRSEAARDTGQHAAAAEDFAGSVIVTNPDANPPDLKRYELKIAGDIWMKVLPALPEALSASLQAAVSRAEPMNQAIKQCFASDMTIDGVVMKRLYHRRTA